MPYNKNIDRQPTMITVTFTAEQIAAFTEALDRAVDCPMLEDDNSTDLVATEPAPITAGRKVRETSSKQI